MKVLFLFPNAPVVIGHERFHRALQPSLRAICECVEVPIQGDEEPTELDHKVTLAMRNCDRIIVGCFDQSLVLGAYVERARHMRKHTAVLMPQHLISSLCGREIEQLMNGPITLDFFPWIGDGVSSFMTKASDILLEWQKLGVGAKQVAV